MSLFSVTQKANREQYKEAFEELIEYIKEQELDFVNESEFDKLHKEIELLSERIMFIETCLQDNSKKLNLDSLRL